MYGIILAFIIFNNFGTQHLNGPRHLFLSFCCTTWRIFEPLRVYEPSFNTDKYSTYIHTYVHTYVLIYTHLPLGAVRPWASCVYISTYVRTYIHTYIYIHMCMIRDCTHWSDTDVICSITGYK